MHGIKWYEWLYAGLLFSSAAGLFIADANQPIYPITQVRVASIEQYSVPTYRSSKLKGRRVRVEGLNRVIDFAESRWNNKIEEGDLVDIVVKENIGFPGSKPALDGLSIKVRK